MKFEMHLTFSERPEPLVGWTASAITDDPVLGPGNKFYLTSYAGNIESAMVKFEEAKFDRHNYIRAKMELILIDEII